MKLATIAVLAVTAMVATSAVGFCQTGRSVGMGYTGIGLADQADAWYWNPAGLAYMNVNPVDGGDASGLKWQGIAGADFGGDVDLSSLHLGGLFGTTGFAVGRVRSNDGNWTDIGIGFGTTIGSPQWSVGGTILASEWGASDTSETELNLGAMYQWHPAIGKGKPAKIGFTAEDVTEAYDTPTIYSAGVSFWVGNRVLIAADAWDLTDETEVAGDDESGMEFNVGAEVLVAPWLALRAGSQDGNFAFGAGVNYRGWKIDAGFVTWDNDYPMSDSDGQLISVSRDW